MRIELEPGYALHARPYRETSLLLEAFTRGHGRIGLVARGARGQRSRLRGVLRPFAPLLLSWSGRGELATLTGAEPTAAARLTSGRLLAGGLYLNELLVRLLARNDPHPALYDAYDAALTALVSDESPEPVMRVFETRLLSELGYGLTLERDAEGRALRPDALYHYHLESGAVLVHQPVEGMLVVHGETLMALRQGRFDNPRSLREAKRLTRAALSRYLGDRPLRSRELWRVRRQPFSEENGHA